MYNILYQYFAQRPLLFDETKHWHKSSIIGNSKRSDQKLQNIK